MTEFRGRGRVRWNGRGRKPWDRRYRVMRDGEGHEGGEGGGGDGGPDGGAGGGGDGGGEAAPWYGALSAEASGSAPSDADWMKGKGFGDPAAMVKSYRALEGKLAKDSRVEIPGEDASDEARAAFHKAIGVPDDVEGYAFAPPEGWEADMAVLGAARDAALKGGTPAKAWDGIVGAVQGAIMDAHNAHVDGLNADRDALFAAWGGQKDQNEILAKRGFEAFGLDADMVAAMQGAAQATLASRAAGKGETLAAGQGGAAALLNLGLELGRLAAEDGFVAGGKKDFGMTAADARAKLEAFENDRAKIAKLGTNDPATVAEHERLLAIIATDRERQERQR